MAVVLTSTIPIFCTPEEHRNLVTSTPQNLADIPPVLRHKQDDVLVVFDPPVSTHPEWSVGTLYVIDSYLVFMQNQGDEGVQIQYPAITLHAISRTEGERPAVYCQLDDAFGETTRMETDDDDPIRELKIIPNDATALNNIFEALSLCASLHPDAALPDDDEDDEAFIDTGNFDVFDGTEEEELSAVGRVRSDFINNNRYQPY
ncbi:hypothetical protein BDZ89DRAFT_1068699 [Hymenopellis radicata]|nr:hypothetical protein BDZ89DRAFT_1068699 [Hymenopellis radicata]